MEMVNVNFSQTDWIIISGLVTALVTLAIYIKQITKIHRNEQKENLVNMINAMGGNTRALEGNTTVINEMKNLMHTVNERIIKLDAKNGNGH
jgi:hypothetical protein